MPEPLSLRDLVPNLALPLGICPQDLVQDLVTLSVTLRRSSSSTREPVKHNLSLIPTPAESVY